MNINIKSRTVCVAAVAFCAAVAPTHALPLGAGGSGVPTPSTVPTSALLGTVVDTFAVNSILTGTVTTRVYDVDLLYNPLGGLTFTYDIVLDSNPPNDDALARMSLEDWGGFDADARQFVDLGEYAAVSADRSLGEDVIGFDFGTLGLPSTFVGPATSATLILASDALSFRLSDANFIDGGVDTADTYAPQLLSVPEGGATLVLMGAALSGLAMARRKKA